MPNSSFTGYMRAKKTRRGVLVSEMASRTLISIVGIGVIAAVFLVFVFLASVVFPLMRSTRVNLVVSHPEMAAADADDVAYLLTDEYLTAGVSGQDGGRTVRHYRLDTGRVLGEYELFTERPTSVSYTQVDGWLVTGFQDGSTALGQVLFETRFYENEQVDSSLQSLREGEIGILDSNTVERTPSGQLRQQALVIRMENPIAHPGSGSVVLLDKTIRSSGPVIAILHSDGTLRVESIVRRRNILTGVVTTEASGASLRLDGIDASDPPKFMMITAIADSVYLIWKSGRYIRVDARDPAVLNVVESGTVLSDDARVTSASFLLGRGTIVIGDDRGRVRTWFRVRRDDAGTPDNLILENAATFVGSSEVSSIAASARKRQIAVGYSDGTVRTFYVTSQRKMAEIVATSAHPILNISFSPRDDGFITLSSQGFSVYRHDAPHPEATVRSIFGKIWYEGNSEPEYSWQSSSGSDTFEAKYGLLPLIFGTLKATFFSMLFGVPIALLAAIYTSEFLDPKARNRIKPTIEMMASLPSVVLGFLAALVIAPIVERFVPAILLAFYLVPGLLLLSGYLYQLLPRRLSVILSRYRLVMVLAVVLLAGIPLSMALGPLFEKILFAGDIKSWLDGQIGSGAGGWFYLLTPGSAILVAWVSGRFVAPRLRDLYKKKSDVESSRLELAKFGIALAATIAIAATTAWVLTVLGLDSRASFPVIGPVLGTYVQRNSLIVGFIMGFAIIPIIYTISDDALRSVPEHLRSASLASGATPWQTTTRVIIPTAMSGLFSAIMIGLGRAVGETMIVLMAAGNTPIMEMNIFNGFRTLAANIAVELPEAVLDSTHYRILFLAALTLFVMTFVINTVAELVRQKFRKRAYQL